MKIVHYPDPVLRRRCEPLSPDDRPDGLDGFAGGMFHLMAAHRGVGLAASQVGRGVRLFVCNHTGRPEDDRCYINPEIEPGEELESGIEGCLSMPGIQVPVMRAKTCSISALDLQWNPIHEKASGLLARVWQHEVDHLDGIVITDRTVPAALLVNRQHLG